MTWPRSAICIMGCTLLSLIIITFHLLPYGVPSIWQWQYLPLKEPARIAFPLGALAIFALAVYYPLRAAWAPAPGANVRPAGELKRSEFKTLCSLWLACVLMSVSVVLLHPLGFWELTSIMTNPASNSYYTTALANPSPTQLLQHYDEKMPHFEAHSQTQSAGPIVLFSMMHNVYAKFPLTQDIAETLLALSPGVSSETAARQASVASKILLTPMDVSISLLIALSLICLGGLTVVPIYFLAKWLYGVRTALVAAGAWIILPSFHSFTVSVDQMYPFAAGLILCGTYRGVRGLSATPPGKSALLLLAGSGCLDGVGLFFNVGLLTLLPLCFLFALLLSPGLAPKKLAAGALSFILGVVAPLLLLKIFYDFNWIAVFKKSNELNYALHYVDSRSYFGSLGGNLWDFFAFAGVPVAGYFFYRTWLRASDASKKWTPGEIWRTLGKAPLLWAVVATLLMLDLSGKTRGEVARMWMLLYPAVLIESGFEIKKAVERARTTFVPLWFSQWAWVVTIAYNVRVWGY